MLLTLSASSFRDEIGPLGKPGNGVMTLKDLPGIAIREMQLRGLNVPASMLAGWSLEDMDALRDSADKAGCPCLVLVEDAPLAFAHVNVDVVDESCNRVRRLSVAAHRLGCNALGLHIEGVDDEETFDGTADGLRTLMPSVERFELNMLLAPGRGLAQDAERLTDLIKRVGGFRIGSLPNFGHAAEAGDAVETLRKLAPYAGAIHATVNGFKRGGAHDGPDLTKCVAAIRSVGFVNTLAIEYTGKDDPRGVIERARLILQNAIDAEG